MQNNQTQNHKEITIESLGKLHPKELQLIYWIRNRFKFGEITLKVRDGLPERILKAFESQDFI